MCKIVGITLRGAATTSKLEELEQEREDLLSHVEKYKILEKKRVGDSCKDGAMSCRQCSDGGADFEGLWNLGLNNSWGSINQKVDASCWGETRKIMDKTAPKFSSL